MRRRYAQYRPSRWGRQRLRRYRLFRTAQLNPVGWAAVAALCLIGAATGYAIGVVVGWPVGVWLVIGALLCLSTLVVVDRRRWGRLWTGYSWGDNPQAAERVGAELKRRGLAVETRTDCVGGVSLRYRHRDGRRVARALTELGIRPPHRW
jgi:ABC-type xylose transport system permease subunit